MGADGSKPAPDGGSAVPVAADDEPQGGMRADGGSIVAVHNNYDANKKASDDADLRAVLALKEFEPLTMVKKTSMFGSDKYLLHAQVSPKPLSDATEAYQEWFRTNAVAVNKTQVELGAKIIETEGAAKGMVGALGTLAKEAGTSSAQLSVDVEDVTKQVIAVQERMSDLMRDAERLQQMLPPGAPTVPSFQEFLDKSHRDVSSS